VVEYPRAATPELVEHPGQWNFQSAKLPLFLAQLAQPMVALVERLQ
jgi:hypothetical protein